MIFTKGKEDLNNLSNIEILFVAFHPSIRVKFHVCLTHMDGSSIGRFWGSAMRTLPSGPTDPPPVRVPKLSSYFRSLRHDDLSQGVCLGCRCSIPPVSCAG